MKVIFNLPTIQVKIPLPSVACDLVELEMTSNNSKLTQISRFEILYSIEKNMIHVLAMRKENIYKKTSKSGQKTIYTPKTREVQILLEQLHSKISSYTRHGCL